MHLRMQRLISILLCEIKRGAKSCKLKCKTERD